MSILQTQKLRIEIGGKTVCKDLSLDIEAGQCWVVLGMNGVGKTTLLKTLAGLRAPASGTVLLNQEPIQTQSRRHIAQQLGFMGQDEQDPFPSTVMECALTGRHPYLGLFESESADDIQQAQQVLKQLDLNTLSKHMSNTLSGGEARRLSLATLLVQNPNMALLDEPTNHLDVKHQIDTLTLIKQRCTAGRAALMSLHDVNLATTYASHALLLFGNGKCAAGTTASVINPDTLFRVYGLSFTQIQDGLRSILIPA